MAFSWSTTLVCYFFMLVVYVLSSTSTSTRIILSGWLFWSALNLNLSLVNPYLLEGADFGSGVNFAVAGSTALDSSFFLQRSIFTPAANKPLSVQLQWFKTHLNSTCSSTAGKFDIHNIELLKLLIARLKHIQSRSLKYLFCLGFNFWFFASHSRDNFWNYITEKSHCRVFEEAWACIDLDGGNRRQWLQQCFLPKKIHRQRQELCAPSYRQDCQRCQGMTILF